MEQIKNAIETFVKGGDNNDVNLLEKVLHPKFQNIQDGFFAEKGIYTFSKSEYIELISNKTFGGSPRTINFEAIEQLGNIAIAKVKLESQYLKFFSTIICVCIDNNWQVINNTPKIEMKEKTNG